MKTIVKHDKCTGCKACGDVCPTKAISFRNDGHGFWYPNIDMNKCISCGSCERVCPQRKKYQSSNEEPTVYAAWNKDERIRINSTSGGIFYAIAKSVINKRGWVVGCRYSEDYKSAYHETVNNLSDLEKLMGSKYFQSDTGNIFIRTKNLLEDGKEVLFCGTPCQIDALSTFLDKKYDNLVTMDFICLGINSPKAFRAYVEEQEKKHKSKVKYIQLKNKIEGWQSLASYMEFENGQTYLANKDKDWWIKGYIKENLYMRESCYHCKYRQIPRIADITVGDFWGITGVSSRDLFKGVSIVMVNSKQGNKLLELARHDLTIKASSIEKGKNGNPALFYDAKQSENRNSFFSDLQKVSFSKAVRKNCKERNDLAVLIKRYNLPTDSIARMVEERPLLFLKDNNYLGKIDLKSFFKLNYCSKNIIRDKNVYILPYTNAVIDIDSTAKIYVRKKNIEIGINKLTKSKAETYVRLGKKAVWISNRGAGLFYNTVLEIGRNATFESGFFTANGGSVIICAKRITFGDDVMLGRNIIVYDSDHHQILDENNNVKNHSKEVIIDDHVWLTSNITILKGSHIEKNSIVAAQTVITKSIPKNALVVGNGSFKLLNQKANWSRKNVK